jgi:hypothetical protein
MHATLDFLPYEYIGYDTKHCKGTLASLTVAVALGSARRRTRLSTPRRNQLERPISVDLS